MDYTEPRASDPAISAGGSADPQVSRRTLVAGAAWAVPAVVMVSATPAYATSGGSLSLSSLSMQVPASGAATLTAALTDSSGAAVAGAAVSFSGPSGASFSPSSATTGGAGTATTQVNLQTPWAFPGSTVTLTGISGSTTKSQSFSVRGTNLVAMGSDYSNTPMQAELAFVSSVVQVVVGSNFSVVLLKDGTVWTKGGNSSGQLGDGSTTDRSTWAQVPGLSGVGSVAAGGMSAYAVMSDGSVKAWGANGSGQLGTGNTTAQTSPTSVSGLPAVSAVAGMTSGALALTTGGAVWAWGANGSGQLGDTTTTNRPSPVPVSGLSSGVSQVVAGSNTGYALMSAGGVRAWGSNDFGQVGDGTQTDRKSPTVVSGLSGIAQIAGGFKTGYALASNGTLSAWGMNNYGQVGDGSGTARFSPVTVFASGAGPSQISAVYASAYALFSDGSVKSWGSNGSGQLGDGTTTDRYAPVGMVGIPISGSPVKTLMVSSGAGVDVSYLVL